MKHVTVVLTLIIFGVMCSCTNQKTLLKAAKIDMDPSLVDVSVQQPADANAPADPLASQQWNMEKISAASVWGVNNGSRAVKVMMIGTGINYNHPDLRANVAVNLTEYLARDPLTGKPANGKDDDNNGLVDDFVGYDFVDEDGLAYDHYGYDTYAAGVMGAVHDNGVGIKGIAKQISIYPVRYIDSNGMSYLPMLIRALRHVMSVKPHVVLLNLLNLGVGDKGAGGVGEAEINMVEQALREIRSQGIPVIVGAGNVSLEVNPNMQLLHAMAAYDNVFIVSSSTRSDTKALLANFSPLLVHTLAPGEGVLSTAPNGSWEEASGTYIAAAHVAGSLALAITTHGSSKTYRELFNALLSSTGSHEVMAFAAYSVGRNRLDVSRFLSALE